MPISFSDVSDPDGWEQIDFKQDDPNSRWIDGGFLATAPIDVPATLNGGVWASTKVEAAFGMRGRRVAANFTVPTRHHNLRQLMVVTSGEMTVAYGGKGETQRVAAGEFWIGEAETPYSMTAGAEGVTYIECYPESMSIVETVWHDDPNWVRR